MKINFFKNKRKKITFIFIILLTSFNFLNLKAEVKVVDSVTGSPLAKASIFDKNGVFIGIANDQGKLPDNISLASFPLNIRYVGYVPLSISSPDLGIVKMEESTYTLPEVVIDDVSRNILYLQVYVRQYFTWENTKDTVAKFIEQLTDYAIPIRKSKFGGWKKPRVLSGAEYEFMKMDKKKASIDTLLYKENDKKSFTTNFDITQKFKLPESILSGEVTEYVENGKYSISERWTQTEDCYIYEDDALCDYSDHAYQPGILKLFGASASQTLDESRYKFEKGIINGAGVENLIEASTNFNIILKGKIFKKATEQKEDTHVSFYSEMFVVDRAYLTPEEAKDLKKTPPVINIENFKVPEGIPAPPDEVMKLKTEVLNSRSNS